jgi:hypothetical protein
MRGSVVRANVVLRYPDSLAAAAPGLYQVQVVARTNSFSSVLSIPVELAPRNANAAASKSSSPSSDSSTAPRSKDELSAAAFELSPKRLEFAAADRKSDAPAREITLTNLQTAPLSISVEVSEEYVQSNDCGAELAAGAACHITVRPKADSGSGPGSLKITTGAGTATVDLVLKEQPKFRQEKD